MVYISTFVNMNIIFSTICTRMSYFSTICTRMSYFSTLIYRNVVFFYFDLQECRIANCGELAAGEEDACVVDDGTGDKHADFPGDTDIDFENVSLRCSEICWYIQFLCIFLKLLDVIHHGSA